MTVTDTDQHHDIHEGESHGLSDMGYVKIAVFLAVVTAIEVALSYTQDQLGAAFLPLLLILMGIKFFCVILYFMHLKFDSKLFGLMFYIGMFLAIGCYGVFLLSMHFFSS
jgi:cytochrome c oxidase subunit 4